MIDKFCLKNWLTYFPQIFHKVSVAESPEFILY